MKYELLVVTPTGYYPALNSVPLSDSHLDVIKLEEAVKLLRPGFEESYDLVIRWSNNDPDYDEITSKEIEEKRKKLYDKLPL